MRVLTLPAVIHSLMDEADVCPPSPPGGGFCSPTAIWGGGSCGWKVCLSLMDEFILVKCKLKSWRGKNQVIKTFISFQTSKLWLVRSSNEQNKQLLRAVESFSLITHWFTGESQNQGNTSGLSEILHHTRKQLKAVDHQLLSNIWRYILWETLDEEDTVLLVLLNLGIFFCGNVYVALYVNVMRYSG